MQYGNGWRSWRRGAEARPSVSFQLVSQGVLSETDGGWVGTAPGWAICSSRLVGLRRAGERASVLEVVSPVSRRRRTTRRLF
jgi:hypothetical protein